MSRIESIKVSEWVENGRCFPDRPSKTREIVRYGAVTGAAVFSVCILGDTAVAHAADISGIDAGGHVLYSKLMSVGKWIILGKGGFEAIKHVTSSDYEQAKKVGIQHLMIFALLLAMPYAFDTVEDLFKSEPTSTTP